MINNFNYARFVGQAIDSALNQSYGQTEVIVVDDGSTDESKTVIASFGDRIKAVFKSNGGQGSAVNAGFLASTGEIVIFLDADDILLPTAAAEAESHLRDEAVVKVHWPMWLADADGILTGRKHPTDRLPDGDLRPDIFQYGPTRHPSAPTSGNAWRRAFLEQMLPLPEQVYWGAPDFFLCESAPFFGQVALISEPQSIYRKHGSNVSTSFSLTQTIDREMRLFDHTTAELARRLKMMGTPVDLKVWRSGYWRSRQRAAIESLQSLPDPTQAIVYIDETAWEAGPVAGRVRIPFTERDGQHQGLPVDSDTAIHELESLRSKASAPSHIALAWTSFWWLERLPAFQRHLDLHYAQVLRSDHLVVYDIREPRSPD